MRKKKFKFKELIIVLGLLIAVSIGLWIERRGINYDSTENTSYYLTEKQAKTPKEALANLAVTNLVLYDSENFTSASAIDNFKQIFLDMKVPSTYIDIAKEKIPDYKKYQTVVVLTPDIQVLGDKALDLMKWVESGGNVMFAATIQKDTIASIIEQKLGIDDSSYERAQVNEVYIKEGYMLGHSQSYKIDEAFESAWKVGLNSAAKVYMTTDDDSKAPLVWSYSLGKGEVVVNNFGLYVKAMRGFYAASFSLLDEVGVYPVINSSAFTLDDFPAPVPSGNAEYISRDYNMSVSDFYTNVWWPDMTKLAEEYNMKYTGVVIEDYNDDTSGRVDQQIDTSRFLYFGNTLLNMGGEIGYHGYNHQPLNLSDVDYGDQFSYNTWKNTEAIENGVDELVRFVHQLFPDSEHSVYVPPSNILSAKGRKILTEKYPEIKTIAAVYFGSGSDYEHEQEFQTAEDGIVNSPRITSGFIIDDYNKLSAVSELNMHYVSHHFVHPDDSLDAGRGAEMGWAKMFKNLSNQVKWLYTEAPSIRNMTESQMAGAVQRFSAINVTKTVTNEEIKLSLGNFVDEAYLMIRFNEGSFGNVKGGRLEKLTGNLYLLHATDETVSIERK